jgi:hypothetical protein
MGQTPRFGGPRDKRRRNRCSVTGCINFARRGFETCTDHRHVESEGADPPLFARLIAQGEAERERRRAVFVERLQAGTFRELFGDEVAALIEDAAKVEGLDTELGALRYAEARLMVEVEDPIEQARALASVARAIVQVQRGAMVVSGERAATLGAAIADILGEIDGEVHG